jgi:hypothetical protein
LQSAAVLHPATHAHWVESNVSPVGHGIGSQTGQYPVTCESHPPPQTVDEGQPSAGLWQLNPAAPVGSVQLYRFHPEGQQPGESSHVPGASTAALPAQTSPDAQVQGFGVRPPHGPPWVETQEVGGEQVVAH